MQLYPYQAEGIAFALKHRNVMIADEMGLGKTVQAIGYINANPEIRHALIVCPLSLKMNWFREVDTWLDCKERCRITITHYDALKKLEIGEFDLLIVDEAQLIKNPKTERYAQVKRVLNLAKHLMMLTGTPFENRVVELWPLLQLLKPEVWDPPGNVSKLVNGKKTYVKVGKGEGAGFFTFAKAYCGAKQVTVWKTVGRQKRAFTHWDFTGATNLDDLKSWLKKTGVIRRLKSDVLTQLPPKTRQVIVLPNSESESKSLAWYRDAFDDDGSNFERIISELRADKVAFTEWSKTRAAQGLAKTEDVIEHVTLCLQNGVEKIILFAYHKEVMARLAESLVWSGCVMVTAEMSAEERQSAVDVFTDDPNCKIIIGGFATMGVGYTLTVASLVVFAEIDPVPGRMFQAEDRAHRLTQDKPVLCQYLVKDGTLDARIAQIYVKKTHTLKGVLG